MYLQGQPFSKISKTTGLTTRGAQKICKQYENTGSLAPSQRAGGARRVLMNNVVEHIEYYKMCKPSIYNKEIREKLISEGVCTEQNVSSISKSIRYDLGYSFKKLSCIPVEKVAYCTTRSVY